MKIVADDHIPYLQAYFGNDELVLKPGRLISKHDLLDADVLLVRSITPVTPKLLSGTAVKFVGSVTAGDDHLDLAWLKQANIDVSIATGFNAPPVADYVVSVVAALRKRKILSTSKLRAGVIGVGNVGRLVAEKLKLLNFEVLLCDPFRAEQEKELVFADFHQLKDLDFVSLHVPLTNKSPHPTYHMVDSTFMKKQHSNCILLNASRGAVVNGKNLLDNNLLDSCCFDVWEDEPNIDKSILAKTLLATPHIAGYSIQSKIRGIDMIYRLACEKKLLNSQKQTPVSITNQKLYFASQPYQWEDIVLAVFNPWLMTDMMRTILLPSDKPALLFDDMRNKFNYRHELHSTTIEGVQISDEDKALLIKLGLSFH